MTCTSEEHTRSVNRTGERRQAASSSEPSLNTGRPSVLWIAVLTSLSFGCESSDVSRTSDDSRPAIESVDPVEYVSTLVRCLETGGAAVELENPVTFSAEPGPGMSVEAMQALMSDCREEAGPPPERDLSPETARAVFAQWLDVYECLTELGYQPDTPPSEEVFVDQFASRDGGWHPYNGLEAQLESMSEQLQVEEECPQWVVITGG